MGNFDSVCYPISELLKLSDMPSYLPFLGVAEPASLASSFHLLPFSPCCVEKAVGSFKIGFVCFFQCLCVCVCMYFFNRWVMLYRTYCCCFHSTLDYKISTPLKNFNANLCLFNLFAAAAEELVTIFQIYMTFLEPFSPSKLQYYLWLFALSQPQFLFFFYINFIQ